MTYLERIDKLLRDMLVIKGLDPDNLEDQDVSNYLLLLRDIEEMVKRAGEQETLNYFRSEINQMVALLPDSPTKDKYILALGQFNKETNSLSN